MIYKDQVSSARRGTKLGLRGKPRTIRGIPRLLRVTLAERFPGLEQATALNQMRLCLILIRSLSKPCGPLIAPRWTWPIRSAAPASLRYFAPPL